MQEQIESNDNAALCSADRVVREGGDSSPAVCRGEMPRERLIRLGPQALKDEELLALVLGTGYRGRHVLDLAERILRDYPKEVLVDMDLGQLSQINGLGKAKAGGAGCSIRVGAPRFGQGVGLCGRSSLHLSMCCRFWPRSRISNASTFSASI